jgi:hypothetical protein
MNLDFLHCRHSHVHLPRTLPSPKHAQTSLFGWLVADGWCWFVLREEYCWLVGGGWFSERKILLAGG